MSNLGVDELQAAAQQLWQSRLDGTLADVSSLPQTAEEGYQLQEAAIAASAQNVCGYKIGATSAEIQQLLGLPEAFYGPIFSDYCKDSPAEIPVYEAHGPKVEPEFMIALGADLKADAGKPVTEGDVLECMEWIAPAFEFVSTRFADVKSQRGYCAIADFGSNHDIVIGERCTDWKKLKLDSLPVSLSINQEEVASGHSGMSVAGSPVAIVAWLANLPAMQQTGLKKGEIICCGTCTEVKLINPGDPIVADYGTLGTLNTTIVAK